MFLWRLKCHSNKVIYEHSDVEITKFTDCDVFSSLETRDLVVRELQFFVKLNLFLAKVTIFRIIFFFQEFFNLEILRLFQKKKLSVH